MDEVQDTAPSAYGLVILKTEIFRLADPDRIIMQRIRLPLVVLSLFIGVASTYPRDA